MSEIDLLRQLQAQGQCCAQVMVSMGLHLQKQSNDQLVTAVAGLCGGLNGTRCCGALTGAACMLCLFDERLARKEMIPALMEWFEDEYATKYGGTACQDILEHDRALRAQRCPMLIENTYLATRDILRSFGFEQE